MYISDKHVRFIKNYSVDYIFSLIITSLFIPFIFLSNSFFTFFFLIELISCTIFYKFIVGKFSFKNNKNKDVFFTIFSKNYINILFYQY